jgi:two-component system response regulator FixJ
MSDVMNAVRSVVAVIDDDDDGRRSLVRLLTVSGFTVREWPSATEFLRDADLDEYGCAIVDLRMPGLSGKQLQDRLNERGVVLPIVFLSAFGTVSVSVSAMKDGAIDFLEKPQDPERTIQAVSRALDRSVELQEAEQDRAAARAQLAELTDRELEVCLLIAGGHRSKQIAEVLGIALNTTKVHRTRVNQKTGVETPVELAALVRRAGLEPMVAASTNDTSDEE